MKKTIGLQVRILAFFSLFLMILIAGMTYLSLRECIFIASEVFSQEGMAVSEKAAAAIDGDRFEALARSLDKNDPYYAQACEALYTIKQGSTALYLYTLAPYRGDIYHYILDGSDEAGGRLFSGIGSEQNTGATDPSFKKAWQTGKAQYGAPINDKEWGYVASCYRPIFNSKGTMVGIIGCDFRADYLQQQFRDQTIKQSLIGVIVAVAGIALLFFFLHLIFSRIRAVSNRLKEIAHGDGDLSIGIQVRATDEIGVMGTFFNETIDKVCRMVLTIKDQSMNLSNVGHELSENMNQTAATVSQITSNIKRIKGQVINQSASVTETNATMVQVTENIERLNTQVEAQTQSVAQSSSAVEEMLANIQSVTNTLVKNSENVHRLISASEEGRSSLEGVSGDIQEIAKESQGLFEINSVMENIASQTNLLSMNAAIEAAHAGEAGRGFAVVAGEIRKLANSSSEQSKTISTVLKKIKIAIDQIIKSTDTVRDRFQAIDDEVKTVADQEQNIRNAMEEQSVGSQQILEAIGKLNDVTQRVKAGSTEMLQGSREVIKEGKNLAAATEEITAGINEITSGADYINSAVARVRSISDNNSEHIGTLAGEVAKFKVANTTEYTWDKTFAVGQEMIDAQHRELFSAINKLIRACKNRRKNDFKDGLEFLNKYVEKHFTEEEQLQVKYQYPDHPNHHKIHEAYKSLVKELSVKWLEKGPSEDIVYEVRQKTGEWLLAHIKAQDVRLGAFIRSHRGNAKK